MNPLLKWAGGKRWLLPTLQEVLLDVKYDRLVEPFCGGLAVALGLAPEHAVLNDLNPHLINLYQEIQWGLTQTDVPLVNTAEVYYQNRNQLNSKAANPKQMAWLFYYLNRTCFNGLCRFNSRGEFNVPFGKYKTINYKTDFSDYQEAFKGWRFSSVDFSKLSIAPGDLLYVDPPYDCEFTKYTKGGFTWDDQVRLVEWLNQFYNPMIVSNQATDRILSLYLKSGFSVYTLDAPRRIASNGDRRPAKEMLALRGI
jgi:DNA adenine methylase